ncbi:MAG: arylesterase [Devosiaceae bacterium]|nr:arylesterase [Devosiaceae bacterium MH13]
MLQEKRDTSTAQLLAPPKTRVAVRLLALLLLAGALLGLPQQARAEPITIVALGDSLTAGFGLAPGEGFPARLEDELLAKGYDVRVLDAGVSGDTTSGGLARLEWSLDPATDAVIVELGGNDALRGISPDVSEQSLDGILATLEERNLPTLLAGMLAPPNMGADYGEAFNGIYPRLAERYDVVYYPFFLDGVAAEPSLNLPDGIHPTAEGIDLIVSRILPYVEDLISRVPADG